MISNAQTAAGHMPRDLYLHLRYDENKYDGVSLVEHCLQEQNKLIEAVQSKSLVATRLQTGSPIMVRRSKSPETVEDEA